MWGYWKINYSLVSFPLPEFNSFSVVSKRKRETGRQKKREVGDLRFAGAAEKVHLLSGVRGGRFFQGFGG